MEFLRDEDNTNIKTVTSNNKGIIDSGDETESRFEDGKQLRWLHIIGENT